MAHRDNALDATAISRNDASFLTQMTRVVMTSLTVDFIVSTPFGSPNILLTSGDGWQGRRSVPPGLKVIADPRGAKVVTALAS